MLSAFALTLILAPAHDHHGVPAFDLAMQADVVAVAEVVRPANGPAQFRILETLGGTSPSRLLPIADTSLLGLHYHPPKAQGPHLVFLHKVYRGWIVSQHPGVQRPWTDANRGVLRRLLATLRSLRTPGAAATLPALVRFARDAAATHPDLAAAALQGLGRLPALALRLDAATKSELGTVLHDTASDTRLRDQAARCLAAGRAPGFAAELLGMLGTGRAHGLGDTFGRLLAHLMGVGALPKLQALLRRGLPGAHTEIVRAAWATHSKESRTWLARLSVDPLLGTAVRRTLGEIR